MRWTVSFGLVTAGTALAISLLTHGVLASSLSADGLMPHGHCYRWQPGLVGLHVACDTLIGLAYLAISLTLASFAARARRAIPFSWIFVAFGVFIVACGATHFMEVWTIWRADYWLAGGLKLATAAASLLTAVLLPPMVPKALAAIATTRRAEETLQHAARDLALRVEERTAALSVEISEHKRTAEAFRRQAEALAEARNAALESVRLKSEFVSTMSHELRTTLNVIIGYVDMLADDPGFEEPAVALSKIRRSSLELLEMIEGTLNLNRIATGADTPRIEVVHLRPLWDELVDEFAMLHGKPEVALRWEAVDGIALRTDRRKLKTILKNLVGNALKFTPAGEIVVRCDPGRSCCIFTIRDSGIGISREHLPVIFEIFRQVDSSDARSYDGAGLGLYIVRCLLDQLGGHIDVESTPGIGSTFRFTLPVEPGTRGGEAGATVV